MLTDCAAMTVDCVSYLINFCAERLKHKKTSPSSDATTGQQLSSYERHYRKKMRLLILELAPPCISVFTLVVVTVIAIDQAVTTLLDHDPSDNGPQPNLFLMLLFSSMNFVLDGVNVLCFARADQTNGLWEGLSAGMRPKEYCDKCEAKHESPCDKTPTAKNGDATENTHLLQETGAIDTSTLSMEESEEDELSVASQGSRGLNLNMCSAWTHICADTLRSIAVLIAAGFAWLFPSMLCPTDADSYGAIFVSIIIIISLGPLLEGLYFTALEIYLLHREHQRRCISAQSNDPLTLVS